MKRGVVFALLVACGGTTGGADDPVITEPAPCSPPPAGFVAWRSGDLVNVSKKLSGRVGSVEFRAEVRHVDAAALPAQVDFGDELIEVRPDISLCLLHR
jgi:hypothetical protein